MTLAIDNPESLFVGDLSGSKDHVLALATLRFQGSKSGAVEAGTVVVKLLNHVGQSPN